MVAAKTDPAGGHRLWHYWLRNGGWQLGFDVAVIQAAIEAHARCDDLPDRAQAVQ